MLNKQWIRASEQGQIDLLLATQQLISEDTEKTHKDEHIVKAALLQVTAICSECNYYMLSFPA